MGTFHPFCSPYQIRSYVSNQYTFWILLVVLIGTSLFCPEASAFTASYEQTVSGAGLPEPQTSVIKIKDGRMKMEADSTKGKVISIIDGKTVYSYFPSENKAVKFVVQGTPKMEALSNYAAYLKSLDAEIIGSERIGEYDCDIYVCTDPKTQATSKIWLWKEKEFPVKVEANVSDGVVTTIIENLKIGIDIDDSEFTLPPGVQIQEM